MQLWFARGTGVSLQEQLVTQIVLGILCNDLLPGTRLPSTRELARRFRLHPNTVSAGYRQLQRDRWVDQRRGSGVYVCDSKPDASLSPEVAIDQLIVNLFRAARKLGTPLATVRTRLRHWLDLQPPDHFLLIEPREELRRVVTLEMQHAVSLPVKSCGSRPSELLDSLEGSIPVVLPRHEALVRRSLPPEADLITLSIRSVPSSLAGWLPTPTDVLVGIASGWPEFLKLARTVLIAAGFHKDALLFRDARRPNWHRGLQQTAAVVCDSATAADLPKTCRAIIFPVLSDSSLAELKQYQEFIRNQLSSAL